ncbi:hypothetical protein F5B22DRAFT_652490 [Xylaria bambusicola]|uniref:uncharacterized protein n=1 Tax=Xylaria bambusicola TaxID=326684 RepID=UPI0020080CBF|nr:uncharacterized protein F5B22DRAFT_652490 [Xylaria bambusicola]KAI0503037.1 hypothetical protein F5B22DRAFT_652490 [Xylaria bambusicola]
MALYDKRREIAGLHRAMTGSKYAAKLEVGREQVLPHCVHRQPLNYIIFVLNGDALGLFQGIDARQQFQDIIRLHIASPRPIVFTHNNLVACIILVEKPSSKLAAVADWA